ncbi:hypothetical protein KR074_009774, partial [Drosophila pseudoananassae]
IQAVSIEISTRRGRFNVASVYCPPAFRWTEADFTTFLSNLGDKFLAAGDWNAKHRWWGNYRMCARGRTLSSVLANVNVDIVATGEATCYPYRANAAPSAIDFGISKGLRQQQVTVRALSKLSSDHLPLLFIIDEEAQFHKGVPKMLPAHANVAIFKSYIDAHTVLNTPIATCSDLDAYVDSFTSTITEAAQRATPPHR